MFQSSPQLLRSISGFWFFNEKLLKQQRCWKDFVFIEAQKTSEYNSVPKAGFFIIDKDFWFLTHTHPKNPALLQLSVATSKITPSLLSSVLYLLLAVWSECF